jgi:hypothetical protein
MFAHFGGIVAALNPFLETADSSDPEEEYPVEKAEGLRRLLEGDLRSFSTEDWWRERLEIALGVKPEPYEPEEWQKGPEEDFRKKYLEISGFEPPDLSDL